MARTKTKIEQVATKTPEQIDLLKQEIASISPQLKEHFPGIFDVLERATTAIGGQMDMPDEDVLRQRFQEERVDPAMKQYQEQILPLLQERFVAMGSGGGPAEQSILASAGTRLSEDLMSQFGEYRENALDRQLKAAGLTGNIASNQMQGINQLLQQILGIDTFQPVARQTTTSSPMDAFATSFGGAVGKGLTSLF